MPRVIQPRAFKRWLKPTSMRHMVFVRTCLSANACGGALARATCQTGCVKPRLSQQPTP